MNESTMTWFEVIHHSYKGPRARFGACRKTADGRFDLVLFGALYDDWSVDEVFLGVTAEDVRAKGVGARRVRGRVKESLGLDRNHAERCVAIELERASKRRRPS